MYTIGDLIASEKQYSDPTTEELDKAIKVLEDKKEALKRNKFTDRQKKIIDIAEKYRAYAIKWTGQPNFQYVGCYKDCFDDEYKTDEPRQAQRYINESYFSLGGLVVKTVTLIDAEGDLETFIDLGG